MPKAPPILLFVLLLSILSASHARAEPPAWKSAGQWAAGCDNQRACSAFGFSTSIAEEMTAAWIRLDRAGGAKAAPSLSIAFTLADGQEDWPASLSVSAAGGLSLGPYEIEEDEANIYSVTLPKAKSGALLDALKKGGFLTVTITEQQGSKLEATLALEGAAETLGWIDGEQQRSDTPAALVGKGKKSIATIPAVPKLAKLRRAPATEPIENPALPDVILALARKGECGDAIDQIEPMEGDLGKGKRLYGVSCPSLGANTVAQFWIVSGKSEPQPATFELPSGLAESGEAAGAPEARGVLMNAAFDPSYMSLQSNAPASRAGDCGSMGEWIFDGTAFRLLQYSLMPECQGIPPDAWPVLYSADAD